MRGSNLVLANYAKAVSEIFSRFIRSAIWLHTFDNMQGFPKMVPRKYDINNS